MKVRIPFGSTGLMLLAALGTVSCDKGQEHARLNAIASPDHSDRMPASTGVAGHSGTNAIYQRILAGEKELLAIAPEKVQSFLRSNGSNTESLIAAFQATQDHEYLRLAAKDNPDEPRVQLAILLHDALPGERAQWISRFKQSAPSNSFANYIAAREAFQNQQPVLALQELAAADKKSQFQDHTSENIQALEKLYLADGRLWLRQNSMAWYACFFRTCGLCAISPRKCFLLSGNTITRATSVQQT